MTALLGIDARLRMARLILITDTRSEEGDLPDFIDAAFAGGVDIVQLRDPDADRAALLKALEAIRSVAFRYQGLVTVYESADLAAEFGADVFHLPERGMRSRKAKKYLHQWAMLGYSCHSEDQIEDAVADELVDYLTVGPVYGGLPTADTGDAGLALVRHAAKVSPVGEKRFKPWFAVGGITSTNLDEVIEAGARRIAVSRAITQAADPEDAARRLKERLRLSWNEDPAMENYTLDVFRQGSEVPADGQLGEPGKGKPTFPG